MNYSVDDLHLFTLNVGLARPGTGRTFAALLHASTT